ACVFDSGNRLVPAGFVEVAEDKSGSFFGEANSSGATETRTGTGDDRDLAPQSHFRLRLTNTGPERPPGQSGEHSRESSRYIWSACGAAGESFRAAHDHIRHG